MKAVYNFRNLGPYFLDWLVRSILIMVINKIHEAVVLQYFFVIQTMLLTGISATVSTSKKTSLSKAVVQANFASVASHGLNTKNNNFNIFVLYLVTFQKLFLHVIYCGHSQNKTNISDVTQNAKEYCFFPL